MRPLVATLAVVAAVFWAHSARAAYLTVSPPPGHAMTLYARPGGRVIARVDHSVFGGPAVSDVVRRVGPWLAVTSELVPNGQVAWVRSGADVILAPVHDAIRVSLSARRLELYVDGKLVKSYTVAVGAPSSPTPTGRFSVAEKLSGARFGSVYGCCILGLTAHQPDPPAGWSRTQSYFVAIHGGGGIGAAVSAGCLHLPNSELRHLMRVLPFGTPVFIAA